MISRKNNAFSLLASLGLSCGFGDKGPGLVKRKVYWIGDLKMASIILQGASRGFLLMSAALIAGSGGLLYIWEDDSFWLCAMGYVLWGEVDLDSGN
jgi:hypothetical protein